MPGKLLSHNPSTDFLFTSVDTPIVQHLASTYPCTIRKDNIELIVNQLLRLHLFLAMKKNLSPIGEVEGYILPALRESLI